MKILRFLLIFSIVLSHAVIFAQQTGQTPTIPLFDVQNKKYEESLEKFYQQRSVIRTAVPQVLETELEASDYLIGPGDEFKISIIGEIENEYIIQVSPEGEVILPSLGEVVLKDVTLKEAKAKLLEILSSNYLKAKISVNLITLRKFRIYLTGEVKNPGTYFVQGSDRLSDVIEVSGMGIAASTQEQVASFGLTDWADDTRVQVRHKNGTVDTYDLTRFYQYGDMSQNPYLHGGDIIFIPSIDLTAAKVIIEGNVGNQGIYSLKKDETIFGFLRRVAAINKRSDLKNIMLERSGERQIINLLDDWEKFINFKLIDGDRIIVPTINDRVYVRGEVYNPGSFPYLANYTSKDYIGLAGALDSGAGDNKIVVVRKETGEVLKGPDIIIKRGDMVILPKRTREVFKDYMTILMPLVSIAISTIALIYR
ncbi:MAG: hypothetical protein GXO77_13985 [Calditrichaeota bacterium]|nr:hypothetical protein [Calditrichota bacterium]